MAIKDWSTTAESNSLVGGINWAEGQAPSTVNNSARAMMAEVAEFYQDTGGGLSSGGSGGAYTLTTNDSVAAYVQGQLYAFEANHAIGDTATATLNVNAIGAKALRKNVSLNIAKDDIQANQIVVVAYEATNDCFHILSSGMSEFAKDTDMVFYEDAAPTGWTIVAGVDEHAVRLTKGSGAGGQAGGATGGTNNFSTQFATLAEGATPGVGNHAITQGELPSFGFITSTAPLVLASPGVGASLSTKAGSGVAHGHTVDLRVKWAACIIATKD